LLFTGGGTVPAPAGEQLAGDDDTAVEHELKLQQAEIASEPGTELGALAEGLLGCRAELVEAASLRAVTVAALGTSPLA